LHTTIKIKLSPFNNNAEMSENYYTNELKFGENVTLAKEPQKVNKIPF